MVDFAWWLSSIGESLLPPGPAVLAFYIIKYQNIYISFSPSFCSGMPVKKATVKTLNFHEYFRLFEKCK